MFSLALMDKARFTDKVEERLLIAQGTNIMKKSYPFLMKCFLHIWFS